MNNLCNYNIKLIAFECVSEINRTSSQNRTSGSECNSLNEFNFFRIARKIISFDNNLMGNALSPPPTPFKSNWRNTKQRVSLSFLTEQWSWWSININDVCVRACKQEGEEEMMQYNDAIKIVSRAVNDLRAIRPNCTRAVRG